MKMTFSTQDYEMNHGGKPRGRGSWAFCPADKYSDGRVNYLDYVYWAPANSTYADAKKAAAAHFAGKATLLVVCS